MTQFNEQPRLQTQDSSNSQNVNNSNVATQRSRGDLEAQCRAEETVDFNSQNNNSSSSLSSLKKKSCSPTSTGLVHRLNLEGVSAATEGPAAVVEEEEYPVDWGDFQMYLKSTFYASNDIGCFPSARKWKLRYFTFDEHGLRYRLEAHLGLMGPHVRFIDIFDLDPLNPGVDWSKYEKEVPDGPGFAEFGYGHAIAIMFFYDQRLQDSFPSFWDRMDKCFIFAPLARIKLLCTDIGSSTSSTTQR